MLKNPNLFSKSFVMKEKILNPREISNENNRVINKH